MPDSRGGARYMCSELVTVSWVSKFGRPREVVANLEEIWSSGARLQFPGPVQPETRLRITTAKPELRGTVRACSADFIGYFVDVEFDEGCQWAPEQYGPKHLLDPQDLLRREELKEKNSQLLSECSKLASDSLVGS